ncbi:MAG: SpoIIE family protein phosphatase [Oscillospiraceae bacterium]|nr:SpoIIE family protein phosphatase [Oscillospiraceae bacterium]
MKSIRSKILKSFLAVSLISLVLTGILTEVIMFNLRGISTHGNEQIGFESADSSETALTNQAVDDASALALAKAQVIGGEITRVANDLKLVAAYVNRLYTGKENFNPIPYNHPKNSPNGVPVMQWVLSPGMDFESVRDEIYLHGNMETVYAAVMNNNNGITSIYLTTVTGINSGYDAYAEYKPEEFEGRFSAWYTDARDAGELVFSDTYQDSFGRGLTLSLSIPCYGENNRFVGVLGLDILIEDLNEMVTQTVVGESGYAFLLRNGEKIISAPGLNEENERDMEMFLGNNYSEILNETRTRRDGTVKSAVSRGGEETEMYIIWTTVDAVGWNLIFALPADDILAPAYEARETIERLTNETIRSMDRQILYSNLVLIGMFAVIIAFVIWMTARISGRITSPIISLENSIGIIAGGDLDTLIDIKTGDEIERLGNSVNSMTLELKEYIENIQTITAEKERIGAELDVATKIQASMLPCIFPAFPDRAEFDIYACMLPAKEVGGDFYDFFLIDGNTLAVVMADVSGKGVPAALFMVIAKTLIKNNAQYGKSPKEVFETVNNLLCEGNDAGMFVTAFMGYLDIPTGRVTYVNAGHNPPLIRREGENYDWLPTKPAFVLAGMEDMFYKQQEITLNPGDELFLYTDGVTEAVNNENELFTDPRLPETANRYLDLPLKEFTVSIKREIDKFAEGAEQADDITMLALRYKGGDVS